MNEKIRVLIVDDHPLLRKALAIVLSKCDNMEVVGECNDGEDAIEKAFILSPDVIIMDLSLPGISGVQATEEIVKENPDTRVLAFSGTNDDSTILAAVQAGATGFLAKATCEIDIIKAVNETYNGSITLKADILRQLIHQTAAGKPKLRYREILTKRELEIIDRIAHGETNHVIADAMELTNSTVRSHINHILTKVGVKSRIDLVRFVLVGGLEETID